MPIPEQLVARREWPRPHVVYVCALTGVLVGAVVGQVVVAPQFDAAGAVQPYLTAGLTVLSPVALVALAVDATAGESG